MKKSNLILCFVLIVLCLQCGLGTTFLVKGAYTPDGLACISGGENRNSILPWLIYGGIIVEIALGLLLILKLVKTGAALIATLHVFFTFIIGSLNFFVTDAVMFCRYDYTLGSTKWKHVYSHYAMEKGEKIQNFYLRIAEECRKQGGLLPTPKEYKEILAPALNSADASQKFNSIAYILTYEQSDKSFFLYKGVPPRPSRLERDSITYYCKIK